MINFQCCYLSKSYKPPNCLITEGIQMIMKEHLLNNFKAKNLFDIVFLMKYLSNWITTRPFLPRIKNYLLRFHYFSHYFTLIIILVITAVDCIKKRVACEITFINY